MNELKALEAEHPELLDARFADATRRRTPAEGFAPSSTSQPMLSLDNAYDEEDLRAFDERVRKGLSTRALAGVRRRAEDRRAEHGADL